MTATDRLTIQRRYRDRQASADGVSPGTLAWVVRQIEQQITKSEALCARQQAVIDALRAGQ